MTWRRTPPPESELLSVLLLRAIGDVQGMGSGEPITDMDAVALMCGVVWVAIVTLIEVGITAGYLENDDEAIGLSAKGQHWYDRGLLRRD